MNNYKKLIFISLLFLILLNLFFPSTVLGNQVSLGIYPPIFQIEAIPPITISSPIKIQNNASDPVSLEIQIRPFISSELNNGEIKLGHENQKLSGADVNILQKLRILNNNNTIDQLLLGPQEEKQLELSIDLPKEEPPGDYYFSVLFITKANTNNQDNNTAINSGIASNVLLSVGPKDKTTGYLSEFSVPFFLEHGPVHFRIAVQNTSKHFINPTGNISLKNMFGQIVGNIDLLPVNVLAQSKRFIPDKHFVYSNEAIWNEKILFGAYSAELTIALSPDGPLFKKNIYFVVIPYQFIIGFSFGCIILVLILLRIKTKLNK